MSWLKAFIISLIMMTHLELYIFKIVGKIPIRVGTTEKNDSSSLYAVYINCILGLFVKLGGTKNE